MGGKGLSGEISQRADRIIQEYQESRPSAGFHIWDPRVKLASLCAAVALNVLVAQLWLSLIIFLVGLGVALWARIPIRLVALFLLAPAWATAVVFVGFSVGFGTKGLLKVGPLTLYEEGIVLGLAAAARVSSDMVWMAAVFLTTPFPRVLGALRWFRVPEVLLETIAMAYRYTFLLMDEFHRMREAARARGGFRTYGNSIGTTSKILAQVILRAYDRARRIEEAMKARGSMAKGGSAIRAEENPGTCPNKCDLTPLVPQETAAVLSCTDLCFSYSSSGTQVVKEVTLTISRGEVVVICGPNGSGKTTLLKLFGGILSPKKGNIILSGRPLDAGTRNEAFRHVGILFQDPNDQLFCTHVREDVAYGPKNLGLEPDEVERLVDTAMDLMEVGHLADRPIHRLSHGEMKRVGLAGLIALRPPLILLDEPIAGLDPAAARTFVRLLRHLNSYHGYTFAIVTHAMDLASIVATRVLILYEGRIVADGPPREILTHTALLEGARLEPPLLTRLFQKIAPGSFAKEEIPVTLEEAESMILLKGPARSE